jgi:UDP-glucose 4-epimerase
MADRVLVTGGAGFIGSHLVGRLLDEGFEVRVLDNMSSGRRENLAHVADAVEIHEADLRSPDAVREAVRGCRYVFHEAALGSVPRSVADPAETMDVNVSGTINLLVACRDEHIERLVYASSSSVYGESAELPKRESARPSPLSPYALSKLSAEMACGIFGRLYGFTAVSLRYFNVFGPRQDPYSQYAAVIPRFITALLAGRRPVIYGDGLQTRDFTFVDNVVDANLLALRAPAERAVDAGGGVYNASCGERISLLDLAGALRDRLHVDLEPAHEEARAGDVRHSQASIDLARECLGYAPRVGFAEGIDRTVAWYRDNADAHDGAKRAGNDE